VIAEAIKRFELWNSGKDPKAIHSNLRAPIFSINISEGGRAEFERVKNEYFTTTSIDGKEICLGTLTKTKDPQLMSEYLDFLFSDKVATQDIHTGGAGVGANPSLRHLLWAYIRDNWQKVVTHLSGNNVVLDRFVRTSLPKFVNESIEQDMLSFFKDKDLSAFDRGLAIALDSIHTNVQYKKRDERLLLEWLEVHGYA
jgi:aminopeptidase N